MKLKMENLSPYLPYKLNFITQSGKVFKSETKDCFEIRILKGSSPNGNKKYHSLTLGKINRGEFKPILRPLSDLQKKLTANGLTFIEKLQEIFTKRLRYDENGFYYHIEKSLVRGNSKDTDFPFNQLEAYSLLFKWHFDVFGLIKKGLAVDINTLKQ